MGFISLPPTWCPSAMTKNDHGPFPFLRWNDLGGHEQSWGRDVETLENLGDPKREWRSLGNPPNPLQDVGPPRYVCWFINHEITPCNCSYIYCKATYKATERYRTGAPSWFAMEPWRMLTSLGKISTEDPGDFRSDFPGEPWFDGWRSTGREESGTWEDILQIQWITRWCPPSYKLVYNPNNYRYNPHKP